MKRTALLPLLVFTTSTTLGDWDQWRGPHRNGISDDSTPLFERLPEGDLEPLWTSLPIPSDHDGGHGSPIFADGKVILSVVWHRDVPTPTRQIDDRALRALGWMNMKMLGPELIAKLEDARKGLSPRLRGDRLNEWAKAWIDEHLSDEQAIVLGSQLIGRFKKGPGAIDYGILQRLDRERETVFENHQALLDWLEGEEFDEGITTQILAAVPNTKKEAEDVLLALDGKTGEEIWRTAIPGAPTGRNSSSTPAVAEGKVFAAGSERLHCVSLADGAVLWSVPNQEPKKKSKGISSSPLVVDGRVYLASDALRCFSAENGELLWKAEGKNAPVGQSSPALWEVGGERHLMVAGGKQLTALDPATGEARFHIDVGGQSSPVFSGRHLVFFSKSGGLAAYFLEEGGRSVKEVWSQKWLERRYSSTPIIHEGQVYLFGSNRHLCLDLATGKERWLEKRTTNIGSPILADGKIFAFDNRGAVLVMVAAKADAYEELGRGKLTKNLFCPTPAIGKGRLYIRHQNHVAAYDLSRR